MSKKSRFRVSFDKQHVKRPEALLKSPSVHLYPIDWSLKIQFSWKQSAWLTCQILGLLVNTLAADEMYPLLKRDNLTIPIQMQLSQKQKPFSAFLASILKCRWNFEHFDKKETLIDFVILKLRTAKSQPDICLKNPVSEDPSRSNMINLPNHGWNVHHSTFLILINHCQVISIGKSICFWLTKSWDCLLTHCLPTKSILSLIETI